MGKKKKNHQSNSYKKSSTSYKQKQQKKNYQKKNQDYCKNAKGADFSGSLNGVKKTVINEAEDAIKKNLRAYAKKGKKKTAGLLAAAGILLAVFAGHSISPYLNEARSLLAEQTADANAAAPDETALQTADGIETAEVDYIVDGDTLWLNIEGIKERKKVRLLQINTPESVHSDETKNNRFGDEASEHIKQLIDEGQTVYLTRDESDTDQYGRLLRIVWLEKPDDPFDEAEVREKCLNARMILDGYAQVVVFDDIAYRDLFRKFQREAMDEGRGLWADEEWWEFTGKKQN